MQRQAIKVMFEEMFGDNLVDRLKSELSGDFEECVMALMDVSLTIYFCVGRYVFRYGRCQGEDD